ncbi:zona pellucida sperm-binding protein 2-like [Sycon ciliatum]|uniref:zona pellucida sperm-binding protein 2-like n=1 Tax=Sycon ciliatum TaxID=27933 RepID=UPI0031F6D20E
MRFLYCLTVLALFVSFGRAANHCPTAFPEEFGASCYSITRQDTTFSDAAAACAAGGGRLVEINTVEENNFVLTLTATAGVNTWIGLDSAPTGGNVFRFSTSQASPVFIGFAGGALPSLTGPHCTELQPPSGVWAAVDCSQEKHYVCEQAQAFVACPPPSSLNISVAKEVLSQFFIANASDLHIGSAASDPLCRVAEVNGQYTALIEPNTCDVSFSYDPAIPQVVRLNAILYHTPTSGLITRSRGQLIAFDCQVQTVDLVSSSAIDPQALQASLTQVGFGEFTVGVQFTSDSTYSAALTANTITLGEPVFVQTFVANDVLSNLDIFVDRCFASPSSDPSDQSTILEVINDDCPGSVLAQVTVATGGASNVFNFQFNAFEFLVGGASQPLLYLHCTTRVCDANVGTSVCVTDVGTCARRRRDLDLMGRWRRQSPTDPYAPGTAPLPQTSTIGPLNFVREDGKPGATDAGGAAAATSPAAFYGLLLSLAVLYVAV